MARIADDLRSEELASVDPATGDVVGTVPIARPDEVEAVAAQAAEAQRSWGRQPLERRLRTVGRAAEDVLDRADELARLITRESGKPITESTVVEVGAAALQLAWVARHGGAYLRRERIRDPQLIAKAKRHWVVAKPLGVIGVIGPWNYPFMLPAAQVAFAIAAGNAVVLKPSEQTPLIGDAIAETFARAGVPDGVVRVLHGYGETGAAVCAAPSVAKVVFTGSVATGRRVLVEAARAGKGAVLELGGNDAAIVCADADLDRAAAGVLWAGATNAGQTCAAVERIYVDRRVYDGFVRRLVALARELRPGDPNDPATPVGPMNNEQQHDAVMRHLEDAVAKGATVACGGPVRVPGLAGRFIAPAVLTDVDHSMAVMTEETFGPLLPVMPFDAEREAVRLANGTEYGLGASIWTRDAARARRLAERMETGMVWINDHAYSHALAQLPWGGVKASGHGVTHSRFGFYDVVDKQLIGEDAGRLPPAWWYPYSELKRRGFLAVVESMARSDLGGRVGAAWRRRGTIGRYLRSLLR